LTRSKLHCLKTNPSVHSTRWIDNSELAPSRNPRVSTCFNKLAL
jgi:hypothetical protein